MRIQTKIFYADLFSKSPSPAPGAKPRPAPAVLKPMAPLAPALSSKAPPQSITAQLITARQKTPDAEVKKDSVAALPVPVPESIPAGVPAAPKPSALSMLIGELDIHDMSPRQMTHLSQTLYAAGALSFEDYSQLAFQPELHPDYERTIGALTGEHAAPDRRRDFVSLWNERADFQRRHNAGRPDLIAQSERIAAVLNRIETPMNVMV